MSDRSSTLAVRNPVTRLDAWQRLKDLSPEAREALRAVLAELAPEAAGLADKCWKKHKAPMATYWKAVSVYASHIKRAIPK